MKKILTAALTLAVTVITAQNREIKFDHGSWTEITKKAKEQNKLIFVDAYTTWCGPCKWMAKNTFTNDTVADYFNKNFVCAKIDMEKGEGLEIAKKYEVRAYPNLLFINGDGECVHRMAGALEPKSFVEFAAEAQDPAKQYISLVKRFDAGERSADFISTLLNKTADAVLSTDKYAKAYFQTQPKDSLMSATNWQMINNFVEDSKSPEFIYLVEKRKEYAAKFAEEDVNAKIEGVYLNAMRQAMYKEGGDPQKNMNEIKKEISSKLGADGDKIIAMSDLNYYQSKGDWNNYAKSADKLITVHKVQQADFLNSICWNVYENVSDKELLKKAEGWSKMSNDLSPENPMFLDTYACLLYKSGNKAEAVKVEQKAVDIIKKDPSQFPPDMDKELEANIEKFKK